MELRAECWVLSRSRLDIDVIWEMGMGFLSSGETTSLHILCFDFSQNDIVQWAWSCGIQPYVKRCRVGLVDVANKLYIKRWRVT